MTCNLITSMQVSYACREDIDILSGGVDTTRRRTSTVLIFPFGDVDARRRLSTANAASSYPGVSLLEATLLGIAVLLSVDPHIHSHWTRDNGSLSNWTRDLWRVLFGPFGLSPTLGDFF